MHLECLARVDGKEAPIELGVLVSMIVLPLLVNAFKGVITACVLSATNFEEPAPTLSSTCSNKITFKDALLMNCWP